MSQAYFASVPQPGPGDLITFRDAAITYAACRRHGSTLQLEAGEEALDLLQWLGVEGQAAPVSPSGLAYLDPSRTAPAGVRRHVLCAWGELPLPALEDYRRQGYVAEAIFAALIRSSYGSDSAEFYPTRSELGFYFEDGLLRAGTARWDQDYLEACQAFFMEELMPAELVAKSLASLPAPGRHSLLEVSRRWEEELHGVTFLVAADLVTLRPLADLLQGLLGLNIPVPGLKELVQSLPGWEREAWVAAWSALPQSQREALSSTLCPGFGEEAEGLLYTAGPDFLLWRAEAVTEALR